MYFLPPSTQRKQTCCTAETATDFNIFAGNFEILSYCTGYDACMYNILVSKDNKTALYFFLELQIVSDINNVKQEERGEFHAC